MQKFNDYIKLNEATVDTKKFSWKRNKTGGISLKQGKKTEGYISVAEDRKTFIAVMLRRVGKEFSKLEDAKNYIVDSALSFYRMNNEKVNVEIADDNIKPIYWRDYLNDD